LNDPCKTSKNKALELWITTGRVDDYFWRLGGAGRYPGKRDWHAPALILVAIDQILFDEMIGYERDVTDLIRPPL
jgi:hypothetical protein